MSLLSRIDLRNGSGVWLSAGVIAAGTLLSTRWEQGQGTPLTRSKRRMALENTIFNLIGLESVQTHIDRLTRSPNVGFLLNAMAGSFQGQRALDAYDQILQATSRRRSWHRLYPLGVSCILGFTWIYAVPHDRRLERQFAALPLEEGNRWRDLFVLITLASPLAQEVDGLRSAARIVIHMYATGSERAVCLRSLLYGLSWIYYIGFSCAGSIRPLLHLLGRNNSRAVSTTVQYGLYLSAVTARFLGAIAPHLPLGQAGGPAHNRIELLLERMLRIMLVLSCYTPVRRLALAVHNVVPRRPLYAKAHLWQLRSIEELELLHQMFKTTIYDARHVLAPYVDMEGISDSCDYAPLRAAQALASAVSNYEQRRVPHMATEPNNPLLDAAFEDERFIAAVSRLYRQVDTGKKANGEVTTR